MIRSAVVARVVARPMPSRTPPDTMSQPPESTVSRASTAKPAAAAARPAQTTTAGRVREASAATTHAPATAEAAPGSRHSPAASGLIPVTSCRCCPVNSADPTMPNAASRLVPTAALNAGAVNSARSIRGSVSRRCRRANTPPSTTPIPMASTGGPPRPCVASTLMP